MTQRSATGLKFLATDFILPHQTGILGRATIDLIILASIVWFVWSGQYLAASVVILGFLILIRLGFQSPKKIALTLDQKTLKLNDQAYPLDGFRSFATYRFKKRKLGQLVLNFRQFGRWPIVLHFSCDYLDRVEKLLAKKIPIAFYSGRDWLERLAHIVGV